MAFEFDADVRMNVDIDRTVEHISEMSGGREDIAAEEGTILRGCVLSFPYRIAML